ncbi:hypothetical protein LEMLEM_LOCUS23173 [Lemmus lemmus]
MPPPHTVRPLQKRLWHLPCSEVRNMHEPKDLLQYHSPDIIYGVSEILQELDIQLQQSDICS